MSNRYSELLATGKTPILPFEEVTLRARLAQLGVRQSVMAELLSEAMDISSETWHDNHAAEIVSADSRGVSDEAEKIIRTLQTALVVPYGSVEPTVQGGVTLGSVVNIEFTPNDIVPMLLTGTVPTLPREISEINPTLEALTVASPLGEAVMDAQLGDELNLEVDGRPINVKVGEIATFNGVEVIGMGAGQP